MKSKKAKEYIDKEIIHMDNERLKDSYGYNEGRDGISYLEIDDVRKAVELAEYEAEERMRKRAAKAYCDECCWAAGTACEREVAHCAFLRAFTKKLNGE